MSAKRLLVHCFLLIAALVFVPLTSPQAHADTPLLEEMPPPGVQPPEAREPVITLYRNNAHVNLNNGMGVLEDKSGGLTIEDVSSAPLRKDFVFNPDKIDAHNFGLTNSAYWIVLTLDYPAWAHNTDAEKEWYLEIERAQLQEAELYIQGADGSWQKQQVDLRQPYSKRKIRHPNSVFPITTRLGEQQTLYIRIKSDNALILPLNLWTPKKFTEKVADNELLYGVFFGGMLILMLYNLFVYFSVRDISYLYFVLYLFGLSYFELIETGHGITLFEDSRSWVRHEYTSPLIWSTWWVVIMFTRKFLDTRRYHLRIDHVLRFLQSFILMYLVTSFLLERDVVSTWLSGFTVFGFVLLLGVSFYSWSRKNENAVYFTIGWMMTVAGGALQALALLKILPSAPLYLAGAPIGFLAGAVMISFSLADRIKRLQREALAANERAIQNMARFRSTFNNAIEGMYRMSTRGHFVSANPALARLLGYDSVDALKHAGNDAVQRCFPNGEADFQQLAWNGRLQMEIAIERPDGKTAWADHFAQLIRNSDGSPSHFEGSLTDITERKERERAEQDREIDKLEKELATASAAAKGDFLANMSHEIRTPLTAIIGYSESLGDNSLSEAEENQAIDTIIRSSHHLLNIINDILDFSKVEASIVDVEKVPVNPYTLLKDVYSYFAQKAKSQNLAFNIDYQFPLPNQINADPTRLKQILLNLCSNALKFTSTGGVTVEFGWDEVRQLTRFSVIDTGTGLTEAQLGKLFQVYSQAEASTARQFGGTGLGLVISKQLAEKMGGTIEVESTPGKGSRFTVYVGGGVPNRREWITSLDEAQNISETIATTLVQIPRLQGKVLYADDNQDSQRLVSMILRETGAQITLANNGKEAVEAMQGQSFDLVLMDIKMPIMSGTDATRILREQGFTTPIIALTANVIKGETAAYVESGFTTVLGKPIDRAQFFQTMEKHLGGNNVSQRSA